MFCQTNENDMNEPEISTQDNWSHNQTTMFVNKYCESIDLPSVANKVAEMIVNYETSKRINIENENDFEIDNEIISEEEFLRTVDEELDKEQLHQDNLSQKDQENDKFYEILDQMSEHEDDGNSDSEHSPDNLKDMQRKVENQVFDDLDIMFDPSANQSQKLVNMSNQNVNNVMNRLEKICVAPGEGGGFKNWGKDIFAIAFVISALSFQTQFGFDLMKNKDRYRR